MYVCTYVRMYVRTYVSMYVLDYLDYLLSFVSAHLCIVNR